MKLLKSVDKDKSGTISSKELLIVFAGSGISEKELKAFIARHDKDGDGELDIEELATFLSSPK